MTYCVLFIYVIFACSVRDVMRRYFISVYLLREDQILDYIDSALDDDEYSQFNAPVLFGRTWKEQKTAFFYAMWCMGGDEDDGAPSARDEYDYIIAERNRIKFDRMHSTMRDLKFDGLADDEECGLNSTTYSLGGSSNVTLSLLPKTTTDCR